MNTLLLPDLKKKWTFIRRLTKTDDWLGRMKREGKKKCLLLIYFDNGERMNFLNYIHMSYTCWIHLKPRKMFDKMSF